MIFGDVAKALFGDKGLAGEVIGVLKTTGVLKDPEQELRVKQALQAYELSKGAQDIKLDEIHAQDRQGARAMQSEALKQDDIFSKRFIYVYASVITFLTFAYVFFITFFDIPDTNVRFADTILGFLLGTTLSTIVAFFFGSSRGSREKDAHIGEAIKKMGGK